MIKTTTNSFSCMVLNGDNYRTLQFHRDSPEKWQVREVNNVQPDVMRTKSFVCDHAAGLFTCVELSRLTLGTRNLLLQRSSDLCASLP